MDSIDSSIIPLLNFLIEQAKIEVDLSSIKLEAMNDGEMGSHKFQNNNLDSKFGCEAASCCFADTDGIVVSATLNLDQYGALYELDLFKGDFSKLQRWPLASELKVT